MMTAVTKEGPWALLLTQQSAVLKRQCNYCCSTSEAPLAAPKRLNTAALKGRVASNRVAIFKVVECSSCHDPVCDLCLHNFGGECRGEGGSPCPVDADLCPSLRCCYSDGNDHGMCQACGGFVTFKRSEGLAFSDFVDFQLGETPVFSTEFVDPLQVDPTDAAIAANWLSHLMPDQCSGTKSSTAPHLRTTVVSSFWNNLSSPSDDKDKAFLSTPPKKHVSKVLKSHTVDATKLRGSARTAPRYDHSLRHQIQSGIQKIRRGKNVKGAYSSDLKLRHYLDFCTATARDPVITDPYDPDAQAHAEEYVGFEAIIHGLKGNSISAKTDAVDKMHRSMGFQPPFKTAPLAISLLAEIKKHDDPEKAKLPVPPQLIELMMLEEDINMLDNLIEITCCSTMLWLCLRSCEALEDSNRSLKCVSA